MIAGRRLVLSIGDAGALLVEVVGRRITGCHYAEDDAAAALFAVLVRSRRAPVTVLIDTLEQSYREEAVPPAGLFDRARLAARRLDRALPGVPLKAALAIGREDSGRRDRRYLFAGAAAIPALTHWLERLDGLPNPVRGVGLLPVESQAMAAALAAPAEWQVLIGLHRTGGIRQIVLRRGRLLLTRLTAAPEPAAPDQAVAAAIAGEFHNTLEYLKRTGFSAGDRMAVAVVAAAGVAGLAATAPMGGAAVATMTPADAARRLGIRGLAQTDGGWSDPLHAAFAARRRSLAMPLSGDAAGRGALRRLSQSLPRQLRAAAAAVAIAGLATIGWMGWQMRTLDAAIAAARSEAAALSEAVAADEARAAALPAPLDRMVAVIRLGQRFAGTAEMPGAWLDRIAPVLGPDARIVALSWTLAAEPGTDPAAPALLLTVELTGFDGDTDAAAGEAGRLLERLRGAFPDQAVAMRRQVVDSRPTEILAGVAGLAAGAGAVPVPTVEIAVGAAP